MSRTLAQDGEKAYRANSEDAIRGLVAQYLPRIEKAASVRRKNELFAEFDKAVKQLRLLAFKPQEAEIKSAATKLAVNEAAFVVSAVKEASAFELNFNLAQKDAEAMASEALLTPFEGVVLAEAVRRVWAADVGRISQRFRVSAMRRDNLQQATTALLGSNRRGFKDGVVRRVRANLEATVVTATNGIIHRMREQAYAKTPFIKKERFVATLDRHTTPICISNDQRKFKLNEGLFPPLHMNCRSIRVPVFEFEVLADRPYVAWAERELVADYTAQAGLPATKARATLPRGHKGRYDRYARGRRGEFVGTVDSRVAYPEFLARQSLAFQQEVLGVRLGKMYRDTGMNITNFISRTGRKFTIDEVLKRLD